MGFSDAEATKARFTLWSRFARACCCFFFAADRELEECELDEWEPEACELVEAVFLLGEFVEAD
ncbi:MAG TPA: hypothetical protein VK473_04140 [Terriglobales bacterium]|nr:hypothetical protein [Terriglobales bacterium]